MQVDVSESILAGSPKYPPSGLSAKVMGNYSVFELPGQTLSRSESDLVFKVLQSLKTASHCYSRQRFNHRLCCCVGYCNLPPALQN